MSNRGGEGPKSGSDETKYLAIALLVVIAGWLLWSNGRGFLALLAFGPDWVQLKALDALGFLDANGRAWLDIQADILGSVFGTVDADRRIDVYQLEWGKHFIRSSEIVGARMRWPIAGLLAILTVVLVFRMRGEGFRRQFTLTGRTFTTVFRVFGLDGMSSFLKGVSDKSKWHPLNFALRILMMLRVIKAKKEWVRNTPDFASYQAQHWKVAMIGANFNPDTDDARTAQAMTPPEWMRANKVKLTRQDGLDREAAGRAFSQQLGTAWIGVRHAPYHAQAICVMAALNRQWATAKLLELRNQMAVVHATNSPAAAEKASKALLVPFLKDQKLVRGIDRVCGKHFYTSTAVMRIYGWGGPFPEWDGGEGAELAPAKFLWLKPVDRNLWYALQQVGRRAFMIEGSGTVSHFFYERIAGNRPISEPKVIQAIEGLEKYLAYHSIKDIDEFSKIEPDF